MLLARNVTVCSHGGLSRPARVTTPRPVHGPTCRVPGAAGGPVYPGKPKCSSCCVLPHTLGVWCLTPVPLPPPHGPPPPALSLGRAC
jgi:hypothetical protein